MNNLVRLSLVLCSGIAFCVSKVGAQPGFLTIQAGTPPPGPGTLVSHGDTWRYRRGTNEPQIDWQTALDVSLDVTWLSGPGGFGYGDAGIQGEATTIVGMRSNHSTLYIRREFQVTNSIGANTELHLQVDYDDGFVAYLDGIEIARRNVAGANGSPVAFNSLASASHEASCCTTPTNQPIAINLGAVSNRLAVGTHVLSFVALNDDVNSGDLHIIPDLILAPRQSTTIVSRSDAWRYRRGTNEPQADWRSTADASLDATWLSSPGGFGYGDAGIQGEATTITGMRSNHTSLYLRREFQITESVDANEELRLVVDYDDGFTAWFDGVELTRANVGGATGTPVPFDEVALDAHEASCCTAPTNPAETFGFGPVGDRLGAGTHVLSFMVVNDDINSSDLHLIPDLMAVKTRVDTNIFDNGLYAVTSSNSILLRGSNTIAGSTRVTINGDAAMYDATNGTWMKMQSLRPGWNHLFVAALDDAGNVLSNVTQDVIYEMSRVNLGGTLASSMAVSNSGTVLYITNDLVVPANVTLEIANGAVVLVNPGRSIMARNGGRIDVRGTFDERVYFHVHGPASTRWGPLGATGSNSVLELRFANVARAQVNATTNAYGLVEDSELHDFDPGAVAGTLGRPIMMCNFASLFQARRNHYWNYHETLVRNGVIQIEECLFEHMVGDALDFDAAQPGSYLRRSTFRHGVLGNVDAVDVGPADLPGSTDTRIEDCIMWNFPFDKGVSVGDENSSHGIIVSNCLIYSCQSGVMAKDLCDVSVRNCTIVQNISGFTNYNKEVPTNATGGGIITNSYNNILWNNITTIGLANDGRVYADHNVLGNTNWPGEGNIDVDPLFVDASARDYRLQSNSPCIGSGRSGATMGITYPLGGIPAAPLRLAMRENGTNALTLAWADNSDNEDGTVVQRSTDAMNWQVLDTVPPHLTNYTDAAATPGLKFYYRVQHTNYVGRSLYSNIAAGRRAGPNDVDSDSDGIPDSWELAYGLNPTNAADAAADVDADGLHNLAEYIAGTNPTNASSRLAASITPAVANAVGVQFDAISNKSYTLQHRASFSTGTWLRLQDFTPELTNRKILFTNDLVDPVRFFRVVTPQAP